jgi:serine phosphatase RsbU (regulator of sigma subunit)
VDSLRLGSKQTYTVGRSNEADWPLPDSSVSRRHASISHKAGQWLITDLGSRHGTTVNGSRLAPESPIPLRHGDEIGFGTWRCRCSDSNVSPGVTTQYIEGPSARENISAIDASRMSGVAQRGLDALLNLSGALDRAVSVGDVAEAVVAAVRDATGCRRVVVARPASASEVEVLASATPETLRLSRSLIDAAAAQGLVELRVTGNDQKQAQSIMELNIRSAICAPIVSGGSPAAFLVMDARDSEGALPPDAAAFCQSVTRLAGLAFERISAAVLAQRNRQLHDDLEAARRAQELLLPPRAGTHGAISYVFDCIPGRLVAGDLFDIFPLDRDRVAFFLGDVSGKGVGAAMLMAAAQSQLRTQLLSGSTLVESLGSVSADLHRRTEASKFVTLIAGIIDMAHETLEVVDAGHGLCAIVSPVGEAVRLHVPNGFPLGVVEITDYERSETPFVRGSRLVLFSDGAVEQPDPAGRQFGFDAVLTAITGSGSAERIPGSVIEAIRAHACASLADDLTVACVHHQR